MRVALDTNAYSALQQGRAPKLFEAVEEAEELYLPFIVAAELRAGFLRGRRAGENNQKLDTFLNLDSARILYAEADTISLYSEIWAQLSRVGKPIPTNDVWIAALCIQYKCVLATADRHFQHIPLLQTMAVK